MIIPVRDAERRFHTLSSCTACEKIPGNGNLRVVDAYGSDPKDVLASSLPEFVCTHAEIAPVPALVEDRAPRTCPGSTEGDEQGHEVVGIGLGMPGGRREIPVADEAVRVAGSNGTV